MTDPADRDPPTPTIETVWFVEATYAPDGAETRVPFRAEHIARAAELKAAGTIVEIGAFTDVSSAVILVRAESEAAALDIIRADVLRQATGSGWSCGPGPSAGSSARLSAPRDLARDTTTRSTSVRVGQPDDRRESVGRRARPSATTRRTSPRWRRTTSSGTTRSCRAALRARTTASGRSSTIATAGIAGRGGPGSRAPVARRASGSWHPPRSGVRRAVVGPGPHGAP